MAMSVPVIRSVQRNAAQKKTQRMGKHYLNYLNYASPRIPTIEDSGSLSLEASHAVAQKNRALSSVKGKLIKYTKRGPFGLGGAASYPRWFELNPDSLTLSYWLLHDSYGPPKKVLRLDKLAEVETNVSHKFIFLRFHDQSKMLQLQAETDEDFGLWMSALSHYGSTSEDAQNLWELDSSHSSPMHHNDHRSSGFFP